MVSEIKNFLQSGTLLNYYKAVELLQKAGARLKLINKLLKRPECEQFQYLVIYELEKIAGLKESQRRAGVDKKPSHKKVKKSKKQKQSSPPTGTKYLDEPPLQKQNYPKEKHHITEEIGRLYRQRAKIHRLLHESGTSNDKKSVKKRKDFITQIQDLTKQIKRAYTNLDKKQVKKVSHPKKQQSSGIEIVKDLQKYFSYKDMSDAELILLRRKLQQQTSKQRIRLQDPNARKSAVIKNKEKIQRNERMMKILTDYLNNK